MENEALTSESHFHTSMKTVQRSLSFRCMWSSDECQAVGSTGLGFELVWGWNYTMPSAVVRHSYWQQTILEGAMHC